MVIQANHGHNDFELSGFYYILLVNQQYLMPKHWCFNETFVIFKIFRLCLLQVNP